MEIFIQSMNKDYEEWEIVNPSWGEREYCSPGYTNKNGTLQFILEYEHTGNLNYKTLNYREDCALIDGKVHWINSSLNILVKTFGDLNLQNVN